MQNLLGETVKRVLLSADDRVMLFELADGTSLAWRAEGDCCAHAFFYQCDDFDVLIGEEVTEVDESNVAEIERGSCDVLDVQFYTIKSRKGRATIEFRVEHNGYYGGSAEQCEPREIGEGAKVIAE